VFAKRSNWKVEPNRLARALAAHRAAGKPIIDLTASNPTTCGFDYPGREILQTLGDRRALTYAPESKGMRSAREAVASYYSESRGFDGSNAAIDPERIVLTAGTSEAYSYILRLLCEPGDEILVPTPSYPLFEYLAALNDVRLAHYPLFYDHGWHVDLDSLKKAISQRTRAVLVVHPNNPTGSFIRAHEATALRELCAQREMAIVADEVFLDFAPDGERRPSFIFEREALTFTLSGISKICALPQMKLAWTVVSGPDALVHEALCRLDIIADTYLSPGTPVQIALPKLLELRGKMQAQLRSRIAANLAALDDAIAASPQVSRLKYEGGWYAILRAPSTVSDEDRVVALLENSGVLVHPGRFFDFEQDGFLVLSLIAPGSEFHEGIRGILTQTAE
jgi:aspartate/methionine/tyrosine aminotransferase